MSQTNLDKTLKKIKYIHEPTDLQCGQAVLGMLTGKSAEQVADEIKNSRETNFKEMKSYLLGHGFSVSDQRRQAFLKTDLSPVSLLSLETPRCWHWSLYYNGTFYDPEHGIMEDFPECKRKYFWEIK